MPCVSRMVSAEIVDSTQHLARELALQGCEPRTLVLAYEQTAAYDRHGKAWSSARGGVYFTLVLPFLPLEHASQKLAHAAAQAVSHALKELLDFKTKCTASGDVYVWNLRAKRWQKIAGVLTETDKSQNGQPFLLLGVGVHVNDRVPASSDAASVRKLLGREIDPEWILQETLEAFWKQYALWQLA